MSDRTKRILLILGFILVVILIGYGLWIAFFGATSSIPVSQPVTEPTAVQPGVGLQPASIGGPGTTITSPADIGRPTGGVGAPAAPTTPITTISPVASGGLTRITTLTTDPVMMPVRAPNGRDISYYNNNDGKFYTIDPDGKTSALSQQAFPNVEQVTWAPNTSQAILEFPDGANILYNFNADRQVTLPKHWESFGFSPQGREIAFKSIGTDPEDRWLAIASPDGSSSVPIEPLGENGHMVDVNWSPNQQMIATYVRSRDGKRQELIFLGKHKENFRLAVLEGRQFIGQWMPQGNQMLYSVYSVDTDYKPSLWLVDAAPGTTGENRLHLQVETWADKCVAADTTTIYCAVPRSLPTGAGMVREVAKGLPDDFYRIDTKHATKTLIAIPAEREVAALNLVLSEDKKMLFFQNEQTGLLEKLELK